MAPRTRTQTIDCTCARGPHPHGTVHGYSRDGCGCDPCRAAWRAYSRHQGARTVPASDTSSLLALLRQTGCSYSQMGRDLDVSPTTIRDVAIQARPRVRRVFADKVRSYAAARGVTL